MYSFNSSFEYPCNPKLDDNELKNAVTDASISLILETAKVDSVLFFVFS